MSKILKKKRKIFFKSQNFVSREMMTNYKEGRPMETLRILQKSA